MKSNINRFNDSTYAVKEDHKWGILTSGSLEVCRSARSINLSFEIANYQMMIETIHGISSEDEGDPTIQ